MTSYQGLDINRNDVGSNGNNYNSSSVYFEPNCCIFVGRLAKETTEEQLYVYFSQFPNTLIGTGLISCKINVDQETGESKCSGFLNFKTPNDVKGVLEKFTNPELNNLQMILQPYEKKKENRIFLYNVPPESEQQILTNIEREIGKVSHHYFSKGANCATIAFVDPKDCEKALLFGCINLEKKFIPIAPYVNPKEREKINMMKQQDKYNKFSSKSGGSYESLNGGGGSTSSPNRNFAFHNDRKSILISDYPSSWSVDNIRMLFQRFGPIDNASADFNDLIQYRSGTELSMTLIRFANEESVDRARESMNNRVCNPYAVNVNDFVQSQDESAITLRRYQNKLIETKPIKMTVTSLSHIAKSKNKKKQYSTAQE